MKVTIFQGPGEVSKLNALQRLKQEFSKEAIFQIDLKSDSLVDLETTIVSQSLFEVNQKLVIVSNAPEKLDLEDLNKKAGDQVSLVLVTPILKASSEIFKSAKKINARVLTFEGEKELSAFTFLDFLIEQKPLVFVELEKLLKEYGGMYVLSMIYYLLRRNLLPLPASSFLQNKILMQKKKYQTKDWANLYLLTIQAEYGIKSGASPENIALYQLVGKVMGKKF